MRTASIKCTYITPGNPKVYSSMGRQLLHLQSTDALHYLTRGSCVLLAAWCVLQDPDDLVTGWKVNPERHASKVRKNTVSSHHITSMHEGCKRSDRLYRCTRAIALTPERL
jgi:hypothetical protein